MASIEHIDGAFLYDLLTSPRITRKFFQAVQFTSRTGREAGFEVHRKIGGPNTVYPLFRGTNKKVLTTPDIPLEGGDYALLMVHTHPSSDELHPSAGDLQYVRFIGYEMHYLHNHISSQPLGGVLHRDEGSDIVSLTLYQCKDPTAPIERLDELGELEKHILALQSTNQKTKKMKMLGELEDEANALMKDIWARYFRIGMVVYQISDGTATLADVAADFFSKEETKEETIETRAFLDTFSFSARME